jgi:hypothetical protein
MFRVPLATYRVQFHGGFKFSEANEEFVNYLSQLGVSDVYSSPILQAKKGSVHCYDVVDHSKVHEETGTLQEFLAFSDLLKQKGELVLCIFPHSLPTLFPLTHSLRSFYLLILSSSFFSLSTTSSLPLFFSSSLVLRSSSLLVVFHSLMVDRSWIVTGHCPESHGSW